MAIVAALVAVSAARRASQRADQATEAYWQLRYEQGQLSSRLARFEAPEAVDAPRGVLPAPASAFVPLSTLKR